jgi:hypothetical protein
MSFLFFFILIHFLVTAKGKQNPFLAIMPLQIPFQSGVESAIGVVFKLALTVSLSYLADSTCSSLKSDLRHGLYVTQDPHLGQFGYTDL